MSNPLRDTIRRKLIFRVLANFMFIVLLFALPSTSFAYVGEWTTKADMPTGRHWLSASVVDGKIYAIGGWRGRQGSLHHSAVEEYDPQTDTWTKKADMSTARAYLSTSVVDGKIYAIGGWARGNSRSLVEEYDPATDTWTKKTDIPIGRYFLATSAVDGKIYVIGGWEGKSVVEEYDPATDRWMRKADMPTARAVLSACAVNGKIYAIGGDGGQGTILSVVEEYDPSTDRWTKKADIPMPTYAHSASVVNGKIYVMGGENETILSTIMKYDPATDTWTKEGDMPVPRTAMSASVVDGRIYVIGGKKVGVGSLSTVEAYQPEPWGFARGPNPANGVTHPDTWVNLSWDPGDFAVSHDVYLGDSFDDVNEGLGSTFLGNQTLTFRSVGFPGSSYPGDLVRGTTYYWRVDEVNEAEPDSPWKGSVWSFTIQPKIAYNPIPADDAEFVDLDIELSWTAGLDAVLHIVYFGDNFNDVNNAAADFSQRGSTYTQSSTTYKPGPLEFGKTYFWRVDELTGGQNAQTHKGEVWSFTTEGAAEGPNPADGAVDVKPTQILSWNAGAVAASHEVYFGTDADVVRNATKTSPEYKGTRVLGDESHDLGLLALETTYYWRIDEVNSVYPDSPWLGNVWSFTTGNFIVVDDFEDYDIDNNEIWWSWKDGTGYSNHPTEPPYTGNGTGSMVGDETTGSYMEETIVHSGSQSMPIFYDNNQQGKLKYSEVEMTLSSRRDWTVEGVGVLTIWFHGAASNGAEPLYIALNSNTVTTHDNPNAAQIETWTQWDIDLQVFADLGVDLTNVDTIAIGFGDRNNPLPGGSGKICFDDIRLCR